MFKNGLTVLFFILFWINPYAQSNTTAEKRPVSRVKHLVKHEIRKHKHGVKYDNGPGSGMQTDFSSVYDSIVSKLNVLPGVEDATWDKCSTKISIYPGWTVIGVKFTSDSLETCFHIQEGSLGTISLFGWKPHLFKMKQKLIYKKMYTAVGFIEKQHQLCKEE